MEHCIISLPGCRSPAGDLDGPIVRPYNKLRADGNSQLSVLLLCILSELDSAVDIEVSSSSLIEVSLSSLISFGNSDMEDRNKRANWVLGFYEHLIHPSGRLV